MRPLFLALISFYILCPVRQVWARQDLVPGSRYTSARAAALGGAFLPLANDGASALFYNPAALGKIKKMFFEPANVRINMNSDFLGMFGVNTYKVFSLPAYATELDSNLNKYPGVGISMVPNFSMKGFAAGLLTEIDVAAKSDGSTYEYRSLYQVIPAVGGGLRLASGLIHLGYVLQWVNTGSGTRQVNPPLGYNNGLNLGSGLSHNFGFSMTFPVAYLPQFNLVIRNMGGLRYVNSSILPVIDSPAGPPANEPMTIDSSFSIQPKMGNGTFMNIIFEWKDITDMSGMPLLGHFSIGLEYSIRKSFFIRLGYGSGYPSAGIGFKSKGGSFDITGYSEEVGGSFHSQRDTRWLMQYQITAF